MPPSTTCPQSVTKEITASGGSGKSTEDEKAKRYKKLTADIDAIWKEVKKDVEELSKPPSDKEVQKKWKAGRVFDKWPAGKKKQYQSPAEKKDDDLIEKIADPTPEILGIMENVTPGLAPQKSKDHAKFRVALTNTIQCINILGKTVASGVSQVSGTPLLKDP